ncbi:sulfotransferase family 2 domain-containing protein [Desulfohalovibrio reitneri]|uniref:sulfotransferase family 2 domain-containing protein n=1 Tax=Desulfohalovibrio reitneri TaxID=1307759 RepID=UPI00192A147A|nr:sulfotransferase family 2 domain-containing protein [Desulfohalovibrio reitneri]
MPRIHQGGGEHKAGRDEVRLALALRHYTHPFLSPLESCRNMVLRRRTTTTTYSLKPFLDHQAIFVHIPKCAGVSVCLALFGNLAGGHRTIREYAAIFSPREFRKFFKFTVVRNPWDRLVSAFLFLKRGGMNEDDRRWAERHIARFNDFPAFVSGWLSPENARTYHHFRPQFDYLTLDGQNLSVGYVARLETLGKDFGVISDKLGLRARLDRKNVNRAKRPYREYYDEPSKRIVADVYAKDVEAFGYEF